MYKTFRDQIGHSLKNALNKTKQLFSDQQLVEGDEIEEFWALKDVSFEIKNGDRVGIIGRNGAGKSTLLKILSRITEPTTGKISIKGRVASLLEVGTGFHQELTGRENICLNGAILGMSRSEINRKFDEIVNFSGVEKFLDTPVKRYSSGMYVRLAFAIAAHLEPEILIVDEVLAVGDAEFQKKCLGKMEDVSTNHGRTILFVSHDLNVIEQLCSTIIYLKDGSIADIGKAGNIVNMYIKDTRRSEGELKLNLSSGVILEEIKLNPGNIQSGNDLQFSIKIKYDEKPEIKDFCLLIYSDKNVRVAIIDIRQNFDKIKYFDDYCIYKGIVRNLALIEGEYFFGIHYNINNEFRDMYDLCTLRVKPDYSSNQVKKYEAQYRGFIELEHLYDET